MTRGLRLLSLLAFASCSNGAAPAQTCDLDPGLTQQECATAHAMSLPDELPPARGNAKGDDVDAAALGFSVFFDARLSARETVRCATCHMPEKRFADGLPTSMGLGRVTRNSPTLLNAARMRSPFWDGRADSVWSQPLFAFESPLEMNFTRLELAHAIARKYARGYERVFGPLPPLGDAERFPARGKPGDSTWENMAEVDRDAVNRVAANVGKALESYVRKLAAGPSPFDRFLEGEATALTAEQRAGLVVFMKGGCTSCHSGPLFSDEKFHALGVGASPGNPVDVGREAAYATLAESPFTARGPYWDGPKEDVPLTPSPGDHGAFRTPSLRNVVRSGPWGHDGRFKTLADVIAFHGPPLSDLDRGRLIAFLGALEGAYPKPPWNDWPQR